MKRLFVIVGGAAAIIAACKSETTTSPPVVASVTLSPVTGSVQVGDTMLKLHRSVQLLAVLKDAGGNVISVIQTGDAVAWASSAPTVVSVGGNGIVTGVKVGSATITAAIEGQTSNTSSVTSDTVFATAVHVTPAPDSVKVDSTVTLKAIPLDAAGDTLTAQETIWTSSDTTIAVVSNADSLGIAPGNKGTITGVRTGTVTITGKIAGLSATSSVKVLP